MYGNVPAVVSLFEQLNDMLIKSNLGKAENLETELAAEYNTLQDLTVLGDENEFEQALRQLFERGNNDEEPDDGNSIG